jgi:CheY-like chemotaxis protein
MAEILILIAEDEPPIAALVAEVVTDLGATPLVARDGRQALALAREQHPAVLVTDLMMPHLNGAELIAALQGEGPRPIPTILMTAAGLQAARVAGADAILPKPFDLDALEALLRRFLAFPLA